MLSSRTMTMLYPQPLNLLYPLEPYRVGGYRFGERVRSRWILWARHLGDDVVVDPGTSVRAVGEGEVAWAEIRPGTPGRRNWGGVVIIGHVNKRDGSAFYSVYGHITDVKVKVGELVVPGQEVGTVAAGATPENGFWKIPHLHFAIYTGPWRNEILPGYARPFAGRTQFSWWKDPGAFIAAYNSGR